MCARFTLTISGQMAVAEALGVPPEHLVGYRPRFNVAPTETHWIIVMEYEERRVLPAKWGLVKGPRDDPRQAARQINARGETVDTRPAFRSAFESRRCAVPVDGFYEWTGPKNARQPLRFHRADDGVLLLAGLFEPRPQAQPGEPTATFTIITTEANEAMLPIHDRMPVVLDGDAVDAWIDPRNPNPAALKALLAPPPNDALIATPASRRVNRAGVDDDPTLLHPDEPALPGFES